MMQKKESKDLQGLVDLGREQGYLTFDQVNDFLPKDVVSPGDLKAALEGFQELNIPILAEVPVDGMEGELEAEDQEGPTRPPKSPNPRRPLIRSANRGIRSTSISRT